MTLEQASPESQVTSIRRGKFLLSLAILSQIATLLITFSVWRVRSTPPNLPWSDLPQIPFLWVVLIFVSAALPWWLGRNGSWLHLSVLILACVWDQFRIQPQFYFGWVFIYAASSCQGSLVGDSDAKIGWRICRWAFIALWLWAGIHKLVSPEWLSHRSLAFVQGMGIGEWGQKLHWRFAVFVGVSEVALAIMAIWKPRIAAWLCIPFHLGIVLSLLMSNWNYSVLPWNISSAIFGFLVLRESAGWSFDRREWGVAALLLLLPSLFYVGSLDRAFSFVLYSGMTPSGMISHIDGSPENDRIQPRLEEIYGWGKLAVPFPSERRTLRQYFELKAKEGSKLHVRDPRALLDDQYFLKTKSGSKKITKNEFFSARLGTVMGVAGDSKITNYEFSKTDVRRLKRSQEGMVYAIEFSPETYSSDQLALLTGYPNLEQLNLHGCDVIDDDLKLLEGLFRLEDIVLSNTKVTEKGLRHLENLPAIRLIIIDGSEITPQQLEEFWDRLE